MDENSGYSGNVVDETAKGGKTFCNNWRRNEIGVKRERND